MTKDEILKQIEELRQQVLMMEEEEREFPKKGDEYFCIFDHGEIDEEVWLDDFMDLGRFSIGNCFKTEEEAKFCIEKLKVIHELEKFSRPFEVGKRNYFIVWTSGNQRLDISFFSTDKIPTLYFESEKKAIEAIEAVGEERIKKYYLEVKE